MRFFASKLLRSNPLERNWDIYNIGNYSHNNSDYVTVFQDIKYVDNKFIVVGIARDGSEGSIWVSEKINKFSNFPNIIFEYTSLRSCHSVAYKYNPSAENVDERYLYVIGCNNCVVHTYDFVNYDVYALPLSCNKLIYANNIFVAVGNNGYIATSTDGITWTLRTSNVSVDLSAISYVNNLFIVGGEGGSILKSSNAISWTQMTSINEPNSYASRIYFYDNEYIVVMANSSIYKSSGLNSWSEINTNINIFDVIGFDNSYCSIGHLDFGLLDDDFKTLIQKQFFVLNSQEFFTAATIANDVIYICTNYGNIYVRGISDYKTQGVDDV